MIDQDVLTQQIQDQHKIIDDLRAKFNMALDHLHMLLRIREESAPTNK